MRCVQAPVYPLFYGKPAAFLAGGISNCPDWQGEVSRMLAGVQQGTLFNPRRDQFEASPAIAEEQIKWEVCFLWRADIVTFWFCKETLCPITLYELGVQLARLRFLNDTNPLEVCIGIEPGYARSLDVQVQAKLLAPTVKIVHSLAEVAAFIEENIALSKD